MCRCIVPTKRAELPLSPRVLHERLSRHEAQKGVHSASIVPFWMLRAIREGRAFSNRMCRHGSENIAKRRSLKNFGIDSGYTNGLIYLQKKVILYRPPSLSWDRPRARLRLRSPMVRGPCGFDYIEESQCLLFHMPSSDQLFEGPLV